MQEQEQIKTIRLLGLGERVILHKILLEFLKKKCPQQFESSLNIFENSTVQITVDDQIITLNLRDNAGGEQYNRLRILAYSNIDIFLIVFQVEENQSLEPIQDFLSKWYPELNQEEFMNQQKIIFGCRVNSKADYKFTKQIQQIVQKQSLQYFEYYEEEPQIQNQILVNSIKQVLKSHLIQINDKDQRDEKQQQCCNCF